MIKFFKKDTFILGIILGLLVPLALYFIIFYVNDFFEVRAQRTFLTQHTIMLVSIVLNVFVLRHFLTSKKRDKTGRGVLISTFLYALVFFVLFWKSFF